MVPATEFGPTYHKKTRIVFPHHKYHARTNAVSTRTRIVFPQFSNMWQLSNLQIDSSVIQIVQSDVLRNSVGTTAAITNIFRLSFLGSQRETTTQSLCHRYSDRNVSLSTLKSPSFRALVLLYCYTY